MVPNELTDFGQERVHALFRWGDAQISLILAYRMPQKVKAVRNMRDAGLLQGECQTAFPQELLREGADFVGQQRLRGAGDNEVIRIPDEIDLRLAASPGFGIRPL